MAHVNSNLRDQWAPLLGGPISSPDCPGLVLEVIPFSNGSDENYCLIFVSGEGVIVFDGPLTLQAIRDLISEYDQEIVFFECANSRVGNDDGHNREGIIGSLTQKRELLGALFAKMDKLSSAARDDRPGSLRNRIYGADLHGSVQALGNHRSAEQPKPGR